MDVKEILKKERLLLDGAMGTMLQEKGMKTGTVPETLNILKPDWIIDIHRSYINAGANIIYANTFGANSYKLQNTGYSVNELISKAIENGKEAAQNTHTLVALDIGPIGQLLEPTGTLSFEDAYEIFKEEIVAGCDADLIVIETMTDLMEIKAAVLAAKENSNLPIFCTMTFEENMRTFTGCTVSSMCLTLEGLGVDAIGVNCSLGPKELVPIIREISRFTTLPIIAKANAGLPDPVTNTYSVLPEEFSKYTKEMMEAGVVIVGGCCGTTPDYIKKLKEIIDSNMVTPENCIKELAVCSPTKTVVVSEPRVIGERINPTGKKRFKQALKDNDIDYILSQAIEQVEAGAEILDVNVGSPEIDEKDMMVRVVKALQGVVDVPLQIDSTKPDVIEAALRVYNGKAIVNSVNGEEKVMDAILPIVAKYGAAVIGLTLDENGIPKTCNDRVNIAKRILDKALSYGIKKENIIIDCLTLTVSAEQKAAKDTLKALNIVKNELGLKTVLGVSNISFGLPNREIINKNFLLMALNNGLDLPIINPNISSMIWTVKAFKVLEGIDENSLNYIEYSENNPIIKPENSNAKINITSTSINKDYSTNDSNGDLALKAMETGMKNDGKALTKELLNTKEPIEIINSVLIPALDVIGVKFEEGKIFLPQLILAADVAKVCFEEIKLFLTNSGKKNESKGKIVLATVKGDVHDIGKNIVKVILENYGYEVIDLGKDVDPSEVVEATIKNNVHLVGLSALMTTTLVSMEETIKMLHNNNVDCKIMAGGAVLTEDYAIKIGADYYAKDAKMSADIAKKVLG